MSDLDVVSAVWTAWERREMDRVDELLTEDIVFDFTHYPPWPHERIYRGAPAIMQALGEWMLWWHAYWQDLIGYEAGHGCVLALIRHGGDRGGSHVEEHLAMLYYVDGDRVNRWEPYEDLEAARSALPRS
jgi:ketosteroid isomerase-like protein